MNQSSTDSSGDRSSGGSHSGRTIVFFDGYCGLCSHTVDFLIARDHQHALRYSPLQGETAKKYLNDTQRLDLDTAIVIVENSEPGAAPQVFDRSSAVLVALSRIEGAWSLFARTSLLIPRPLRDAVYRLIAKNRFRLFGRRETCRVPSPKERALFLP